MTADLRQEKQERTAGRWRQQGSKKERKRLCRKRGEADINRKTIIIADFRLSDAILYSYVRDIRWIVAGCAIMGFAIYGSEDLNGMSFCDGPSPFPYSSFNSRKFLIIGKIFKKKPRNYRILLSVSS